MVEWTRDLPLADPRRGFGGDALEGLDRGEDGLKLEVLTWNLFHGRDHPPGGVQGDIAWRVFGRPVRGETHVLLNRDLGRDFVRVLDGWSWDVALLQEVPVGWAGALARGTGASGRMVLTSRNWMSPVTAPIWSRRPHLVGSWEGGANLILVRDPQRMIPGRSRSFTLSLRPERRRLQMIELEDGPPVFNLHASTGASRAEGDVRRAAAIAAEKAGGRPFVIGGDLNVSPGADPSLFGELRRNHGLVLPEGVDPGSIDQVLTAGARSGAGERFAPASRDVDDGSTGLKARLSDHDPVLVRIDI